MTSALRLYVSGRFSWHIGNLVRWIAPVPCSSGATNAGFPCLDGSDLCWGRILRGASRTLSWAASVVISGAEEKQRDMSDKERNNSHRGNHSADNGKESSPPLALLASDQEWSTRSLESVLGPHGFASVRAYTGRQALELIRRTHPDVVIIDSGMPDTPGIELCAKLRDDPEFPSSIPVVMTTAGPASRSQRLDAYRAGVWEYLSLPLDAE